MDCVTNVKIEYYDNLNSKQAVNSEYIHTLIHSSFKPHCRSTFSPSSEIRNAPPNDSTLLTQPWCSKMRVNPRCLHLHCSWDRCIVLIIRTTTPQSSNVGAFGIRGLRCRCFLDQSCHCCCATRTFLWFETSPSICIMNSCRNVLRSYEHNPRRFLLQFQPGRSWYGKTSNSSHSQCLLNLICQKWLKIVK